MTILNNPSDPIKQSGPPAGQVLFERLGREANNFPPDVVIDAATNLLVNAIRQMVPRRMKALMAFDDLFNRAKSLLNHHYDPVTGQRRNIFAHTQHIIMDTHKDPEGL
jgi:hypothetical protein